MSAISVYIPFVLFVFAAKLTGAQLHANKKQGVGLKDTILKDSVCEESGAAGHCHSAGSLSVLQHRSTMVHGAEAIVRPEPVPSDAKSPPEDSPEEAARKELVAKWNTTLRYGNESCPCIGISGQNGSIIVTTAVGRHHDILDLASFNSTNSMFKPTLVNVSYSADMGDRCWTWDAGIHPACTGSNNTAGFCDQAWCYVDPCNCNLKVPPQASFFHREAAFQGKKLFYSYRTCGVEVNNMTEIEELNSRALAAAACSKPRPPESVLGKEDCRCIGIANRSGTTFVHIRRKCPSALIITGGEGFHPHMMGNYTKTDIKPGPEQGHRPIYKNANNLTYLYFWKPFQEWKIGQMPSKSTAGVTGKGTGHCPTDVTEWESWNGTHWSVDDPMLTVVEAPGSTDIGNITSAPFPADVGTYCGSWDADTHPMCVNSSGKAPEWCYQPWCFVDPCRCKQPVKSDSAKAMFFQGRPVYYSAKTCGGIDNWSHCTSKKSGQECQSLSQCSWTGEACIDKEVVQMCPQKSAASPRHPQVLVVLTAVFSVGFFVGP